MSKGLRTATELQQWVLLDVNERHPGVVPSFMTVSVQRNGDTWEALANSHSDIAYADACEAIHQSAARLRQQYDLVD